MLGARGQQSCHLLRQAREELLVLDRTLAIGLAARGVGHDQIDVGRKVQLPATELAHTQHDWPHCPALRIARHPIALEQGSAGLVHRDRTAGIRQIGQITQGFIEISQTRKLTQGDARHFALPLLSQGLHQFRIHRQCRTTCLDQSSDVSSATRHRKIRSVQPLRESVQQIVEEATCAACTLDHSFGKHRIHIHC